MKMKPKLTIPLFPLLILGACTLLPKDGINDEGIGDDEIGDEIGNDDGPLAACYGLPQFDLDPLMEDYEIEAVSVYGGVAHGEIACYTPDIEFLGDLLNFPNPEKVPDMSEYIEEDVQSGVICNFLMELPGSVLATKAGEKLPWYTGAFIDANGEFTPRYTACGEPCGAIGIASNINGDVGRNEFCESHILRHGVNPDGNGFNDGVPLFSEDWAYDQAVYASRCQAPINPLIGSEIPPVFVNGEHIPALINAILDAFGFGIIPDDLDVNNVPWTWNFWLHTGVCEYDSFGYKVVETGSGLTPWTWGMPCPNNYFAISQGAVLMAYDVPFDYLWVWGRKGYCYMDGLTVSGYVPPPEAPSYLIELEEEGSLDSEGWDSLLLVQHGGGLSWPTQNLDVSGFDENTATIHLHPGLIDLMAINPSSLFQGVEVRKITRENGDGNPKPALHLIAVPEGSLLDALGYKVGDIIFSVRGKEGDGVNWTNQFSDLHGVFESELVDALGLSFNDKAITVMHERSLSKEVPLDHEIRNTFPDLPEIIQVGEIQERHFFRWEWAETPNIP